MADQSLLVLCTLAEMQAQEAHRHPVGSFLTGDGSIAICKYFQAKPGISASLNDGFAFLDLTCLFSQIQSVQGQTTCINVLLLLS